MIDPRVTTQNQRLGSHWLFISIIVLLSLIIYANTLWNGFVYDDMDEIVNNQWVKQFNSRIEPCHRYRITETSTFYLNYKLGGPAAFGFHLTNLLFHLLVWSASICSPGLLLKNQLPAFFSRRPFCHSSSPYRGGFNRLKSAGIANDVIFTAFIDFIYKSSRIGEFRKNTAR